MSLAVVLLAIYTNTNPVSPHSYIILCIYVYPYRVTFAMLLYSPVMFDSIPENIILYTVNKIDTLLTSLYIEIISHSTYR